MSADMERRPTGSILTEATVIVLNREMDAMAGQGMLAISADGCFYFEGGDPVTRVMSLNELERYCATFPSRTEDQRKVLDLILSTVATFKSGGRPQ
jgi:hypothetical protein